MGTRGIGGAFLTRKRLQRTQAVGAAARLGSLHEKVRIHAPQSTMERLRVRADVCMSLPRVRLQATLQEISWHCPTQQPGGAPDSSLSRLLPRPQSPSRPPLFPVLLLHMIISQFCFPAYHCTRYHTHTGPVPTFSRMLSISSLRLASASLLGSTVTANLALACVYCAHGAGHTGEAAPS